MTNKLRMNNTFRTNDLSISAVLHCLGYKLEAVDRSEPRAVFVFRRSPEIDQTIQAYWADELSLNPKAFFNSLKELKARIYSID